MPRLATTFSLLALTLMTAASASGSRPDPQRFLTFDAKRHIAQLTLVAAFDGSNNGYNFDGYGRGELLIEIPLGWRVSVVCKNHGNQQNSCVVVHGSLAQRPAFAGAGTPDPVDGLRPGSSATFSFVASRVGVYRLVSLVAGHMQARQFALLEIVPGGRPSISARNGP